MKQAAGYVLAFILGALAMDALSHRMGKSEPTWRLVFAHDQDGGTVQGSKEDLIAAILAGKSIRIYWAGRRVQHVTDSNFLTILEGEVFAQVAVIRGQKPSVDPPKIEFHDPDRNWNAIFATNGGRALKWFVQD